MTAGNDRVGTTGPVIVADMARITRAPGIGGTGIVDRPREKGDTGTGHHQGEKDRTGIDRLRGLDHLELADIEIDTTVGIE